MSSQLIQHQFSHVERNWILYVGSTDSFFLIATSGRLSTSTACLVSVIVFCCLFLGLCLCQCLFLCLCLCQCLFLCLCLLVGHHSDNISWFQTVFSYWPVVCWGAHQQTTIKPVFVTWSRTPHPSIIMALCNHALVFPLIKPTNPFSTNPYCPKHSRHWIYGDNEDRGLPKWLHAFYSRVQALFSTA